MVKLEEFAKTYNKRWSECWVCAHPELQQINDGAKQGLSAYIITKWLIESGETTPHGTIIERLRRHLTRCLGA